MHNKTHIILIGLALLVLVTLLTFAFAPPPSTTGNNEDSHNIKKALILNLDSNCDGNILTITSKSSAEVPVEGVKVVVWVIGGGPIYTGYTDENGQVFFDGCGLSIEIDAHKDKSDYGAVNNFKAELIDCAQCERECFTNADCPSDKTCDDTGNCITIECECGEVKNQVCVKYDCCSDADCSNNQVCKSFECVEPEAEEVPPECSTDEECAYDEYCLGTECEPVTGDCGYAQDHMWVASECGPLGDNCPECEEGYTCEPFNATGGLVYSCVLPPQEQLAGADGDEGQPVGLFDNVFPIFALIAIIIIAIVGVWYWRKR